MRKGLAVLASLLLGLGVFAEELSVQALRAEEAPVIDGRLDDAVWQQRDWYTGFRVLNEPDAVAGVQTRFKIAFDDSAVYIAILADEPCMDELVATVEERDGKVYHDDCVEVFLSPDPKGEGFYQFVINPLGTVFDNEVRDETRAGGHAALYSAWDADCKVAALKEADGWCAELSVPLAELDLTSGDGQTWRLNVARERQAGARELTTFSPLTGGFHQPSLFAFLELPDLAVDRLLWAVQDPYAIEVRSEGDELVCRAKTRITNFGQELRSFVFRPIVEVGEVRSVGGNVAGQLGAGQTQEFELEFPVPKEGDAILTVELRDTQDPQAIWAVRKSVVRLEYAPLTIDVIQPCYRNAIYATQSLDEILARVRINVRAEEPDGAQLDVTLAKRENARALIVQKLIAVSAKEIEVALPIAGLDYGRYILSVGLVQKGSVLHSAETEIRKLPPVPHEWRIDENNVLLYNGEPYLPFGWFSIPPAELAKPDNPYTAALHYNAQYFTVEKNRGFLDEFAAAKIPLAIFPYASNAQMSPASVWAEPLSDEDAEALRGRVRALKDHPGLLAWYMADEPELRPASVDRVRRIYEVVADEDPYHPCIMLNDTIPGIHKYAGGGDILMPDPYPTFVKDGLAAMPIEKVSKFIDACREASSGRKPAWVTPQAFNYGDYGRHNNRAPNFTELRNMTYQAVVHGAKGFLFYTWRPSLNYMGLQVGMPFLAREAADLKDAILAADVESAIRADGPMPEHIHCSARRVGEAFYVFAVNTATQGQDVTFRFLETARPVAMHVVSEKRKVAVNADGEFADHFDAYGTHIYTTVDDLAKRETLADAQKKIDARDAARRKPGNLAFEDHGTKVAVSSESRYGSTPARLLDGVTGGMGWRDGTADEVPDWVEVVWPEPVEVGRVVVYSETIAELAVLAPKDGGWTEVGAASGLEGPEISVQFQPLTTDRLRVEVRKNRPDEKFTFITEIEAYEN